MAEENNQENEKKSPLKLILMIVGGIVLLGTGIGVGIFMGGGGDTDPSAEISQIIEKKENPEQSKNEDEENIDEATAECAEEEKDEEGNCPTGPRSGFGKFLKGFVIFGIDSLVNEYSLKAALNSSIVSITASIGLTIPNWSAISWNPIKLPWLIFIGLNTFCDR